MINNTKTQKRLQKNRKIETQGREGQRRMQDREEQFQ